MSKLKMSENTLIMWDNLKLFYRAWLPENKAKRAVILFHRGHEHSLRLKSLVEALEMPDTAFFAWDARGNGRTEGPRDYAENFISYLKDADYFVRYISNKYNVAMEDMVALGHSVGAAILACWVHDFAPPIKGMVLGAPAFDIKLYMPFAIELLKFARLTGLVKTVPSYVKAKVLTHDKDEIKDHEADKLITHSITNHILLDLYDTSKRVIKDAGAIKIPTLLLMAGNDWVVKLGAQDKFFANLGSEIKEKELYEEFYHAIFHEKERMQPISRAKEFILKLFNEKKHDYSKALIEAHKHGASFEEYNTLLKPLPTFSLKWWQFAFFKFVLGTLGRLSEGIRLGWSSGFNSGRTLDYVYENKPRGFTVLGKMFDKSYLEGVGWKGIRVRKINMERLLEKTIRKCAEKNKEVHLVDIATGAGRYVLETIKNINNIKVTGELRDFEPKNLEKGKLNAHELGVSGINFKQGDAFNEVDLSKLNPRPDIALVSGLYELYADNDKLLASLRGLSKAVKDNGYLVYTNQPWHPQLELIARGLCDWDGKPWVMRRRSQAEMDALIESVGFKKLEMEIDQWGIFTVSVALKTKN